jgi:hypothetical protein
MMSHCERADDDRGQIVAEGDYVFVLSGFGASYARR